MKVLSCQRLKDIYWILCSKWYFAQVLLVNGRNVLFFTRLSINCELLGSLSRGKHVSSLVQPPAALATGLCILHYCMLFLLMILLVKSLLLLPIYWPFSVAGGKIIPRIFNNVFSLKHLSVDLANLFLN